jgi:hypothetical protein
MYFVYLYENRKMKPITTVLRSGRRGMRENDGGDNLIKVHFVSTYVSQ